MKIKTLILLFLISCSTGCFLAGTKCCELIFSEELTKGIYLEEYRTYCAGVLGEVIDCYVTDSITFRYKIGSYDEHENFHVYFNDGKVFAYKLEGKTVEKIVEQKTFTESQLLEFHDTDKNILTSKPLFGANCIKCDSDYYPFSSYRTRDNYIMTEFQYRCGNDFENTVYYTDSMKFCVFIGVRSVGSFENNYRVKKVNGNFVFYNITDLNLWDTLNVETFLLTDLKKEKIFDVCKK